MKHSPFLAVWLGLGAVFLGLLTTFFSLLVSQRKKTANNSAQPAGAAEADLSRPT